MSNKDAKKNKESENNLGFSIETTRLEVDEPSPAPYS